MSDCIFCKIVAGEIPCAKVYEDDTKLAFMDINPIQPGHVLLIPKEHFERVTDLPDAVAADLGATLPMLGRAVVSAAKADGMNIHQTNGRCSGQAVFHVHFHLIPRRNDDGYSFRWDPRGPYPEGEMEKWRARIVEAVEAGG
jgi:histidine triad (HIT) family protein